MSIILAYFCSVSVATGSYFVIRMLVALITLIPLNCISSRKLLYIWLRYFPPLITLTFSAAILIVSIQIFDLLSSIEVFYSPLTFPCYFLILVYLFLLENFSYREIATLPLVRKKLQQEERQLLIES